MRNYLWLALVPGLLLFPGRAALAEVRVETVDGLVRGELTGMDATHLVLAVKGAAQKIELAAVFQVALEGAPRPSAAAAFDLLGGDRYHGKLVDGNTNDLEVETTVCGRVKLETASLVGITFVHGAPAKPDPPGKDVIHLRNGDHVHGELSAIAKKQDGSFSFEINTGSDKLALEQAQIARIRLVALAGSPPKSDFFHAQVVCWDGSRLHGRIEKLEERELHLASLLGGQRRVALAAIQAIHFKNGRFVYLTDLAPAAVLHTPYFSYPFPPQFDKNRRGGTLTLRGRTYQKGIGMQSKTRVTYKLAAGFREFRCLVGIDDLAGDSGSVVFRVYLDGKLARETQVLRGGMPPEALKVPLEGATELALEADFADNAHVNDLADWVNPVLLR